MTDQQNHPITPPPELVRQWWKSAPEDGDWLRSLATQAARWGADQELEACCEVLARELICDGKHVATDLRTVRRPKLPSLKEQALAAQQRMWDGTSNHDDWNLVRRALEALDD